jgi:hypothetical protein
MLLSMRPFSKRKASGEPRFSYKPAKPTARAKVSNNSLLLRGVNYRSSMARRFRDLARAYVAGIWAPDEPTLALARSAALAAMRLEQLQASVIGNEEVDDLKFVRLSGSLSRTLAALRALKARQQPSIARGQGGWSAPLYRYLHFMVWMRDHGGNANSKDPALVAEYERLEAEGAFMNEVR